MKTLILKKIMTESLDGCFKTVESTLTEYLDLFSSFADQELDCIENWWKGQKPNEDANLQNFESNLQKAIGQKMLLDANRSKLEDALRKVKQVLSNAT